MFKKLFFLPLSILMTANAVLAQQKTDVWDFGAKQLDPALFNNKLSETSINAWYSVAPGTANVPMPTSFTAQELSWIGGANDRMELDFCSLSILQTPLRKPISLQQQLLLPNINSWQKQQGIIKLLKASTNRVITEFKGLLQNM